MAMEVLQRGYYGGVLGKSDFTPGLFAIDDLSSTAVRVAIPRRGSSFRVRSWGSESGGLIQQHVAENVRVMGRRDHARSVTTRAALLRGLGGLLKQGYVLRNHEIVDEHTAVETTGDVIEKLKNGFKNFKKTQYKCVLSSPIPLCH